MWLFLATEVLFFGGLLLAWIFCRHWQQAGFDAGSRESMLAIGNVNLVLLVTSSFVYVCGLIFIAMDQPRRLVQRCLLTIGLGTTFLVLKILEWLIDIHEHLFPSMVDFKITDPDAGGARLFWSFYFVATSLHALYIINRHCRRRLDRNAGTRRLLLGQMEHAGRSSRVILELCRYSLDHPVSADLSHRTRRMSLGHRRALLIWLALLLLAAIEFAGSFIHNAPPLRLLLLLPALAMVSLVGVMFMRVRNTIAPARGFALAGLLWLLLLLGLGAMDPLTRAVYRVPEQFTGYAH